MGCGKFKESELDFQAVLNVALGDYHSRGFSLVERCDHFLYLYCQDSLVAVFNQSVTPVDIQEVCRKHLGSTLVA